MPTVIASYSDLHLEFGAFSPPALNADVVILAGDTYTKHRAFAGDDAAVAFGCPVIMVMGNHEFYGGQIDTTVEKTRHAAIAKGITLLERQAIEIAGVRFLGCTLWSDFRLFAGDDLDAIKADARYCVGGDRYTKGHNDFRAIRVARDGYRRFRPLDASILFAASVAWLDRQLAVAFPGPTVVITHHAPSGRCIPLSHLADHEMAAYASNLDWLIDKHQPEMWVHGHIHDAVPAFHIGRTLVASNPRGYFPDHLNRGFDARGHRFVAKKLAPSPS